MRRKLGDLTIKLTEISTEYTHYRLKTMSDIAELESKLELAKNQAA